jgi:ELWxxDGT repeat protein
VSIIFFDHYDPATGEELWLNSGGITKFVKDINPGLSGSNPDNLTVIGGTLFFTAYDDVNGYQLWKSDGTAAGTVRLSSFVPSQTTPTSLTAVDGTLFFFANDGTHGWQLWKSDGTAAGTTMLTDMSGLIGQSLTASGGKVFFSASDGIHGNQLWESDGTTTGTMMITNPIFDTGGMAQNNLTDVNGTLYFVASDARGGRLMKYDGTLNAVGAPGRGTLRPCKKRCSHPQGTRHPPPEVAMAVGAAERNLEDGTPARRSAHETRRRSRQGARRLAPP